MGTVALPISGLVNVQVNMAAAAAQAQNTTSLLLLTNSTVIDSDTRIRSFSSLSEVGEVFGTAGMEYAGASLWFGQQPSPIDLLIGRWVQFASDGELICGPLTPGEQDPHGGQYPWTSIQGGSFSIAVDGGAPVLITGMDFSLITNMNAVASIINAAMTAAAVFAACVWNGSQFVFTSKGAPGEGSSIDPMITDIDNPAGDITLKLRSTTATGAKSVVGLDAETALDAVNLLELNFGYTWYALVIPGATDTDHLAVAEAIQGFTDTKHFYGITTMDPRVLQPNNNLPGDDTNTSLAQLLEEKDINKAAIQYSSTSPYAIISALARIMTVDYRQNSSVITLMYKQEPGVTAENLNRAQLNNLLAKNCNVFVAYAGNALIIQPGVTCTSLQFIDTIIGLDNLAIDVQNAIFNLLYTSPTKIPQTDAGMNMIINAAESVLVEYVNDGLMAPGVWTGAGFGKLKNGAWVDKGYSIYCPPIAEQSTADRAARMAGPITIGVKLAGAIHTVDAVISVNP